MGLVGLVPSPSPHETFLTISPSLRSSLTRLRLLLGPVFLCTPLSAEGSALSTWAQGAGSCLAVPPVAAPGTPPRCAAPGSSCFLAQVARVCHRARPHTAVLSLSTPVSACHRHHGPHTEHRRDLAPQAFQSDREEAAAPVHSPFSFLPPRGLPALWGWPAWEAALPDGSASIADMRAPSGAVSPCPQGPLRPSHLLRKEATCCECCFCCVLQKQSFLYVFRMKLLVHLTPSWYT